MLNTEDSTEKQIRQYIQARRDDFTTLLSQIISIPSPTGREREKAAWILQHLHNAGETQAYIDAAGNVVCPCQIDGHRTFPLYTAHIDTVFDLPRPSVCIEGNILRAPSCGDNSAGAAGLLFLIAMIGKLGLKLSRGALFAFTVGEEGLGNLRGIRRLMEDWQGRISEVIAADCTFDEVVSAAVGSRRYAVSVTAEGGHSWHHFGRTNAIAAAASVISRLYDLSVPLTPKTTYNIGTISGGTTINTIAAQAEFSVDLRSESRRELDRLDREFKTILAKSQGNGAGIFYTLLGERPCGDGTEPTKLCRRIAGLRRRLGFDTAFVSGSTDANIPLSLGIPAISFGICRSHGAHTAGEWLELDTIPAGLLLMAECLLCDGK